MRQVVLSARFSEENIDKIKLILDLLVEESQATDIVYDNLRSVRGCPLFEDNYVHKVQKELKNNE